MKKISLTLSALALLGFTACSDSKNPNGAGDMKTVQNSQPAAPLPTGTATSTGTNTGTATGAGPGH